MRRPPLACFLLRNPVSSKFTFLCSTESRKRFIAGVSTHFDTLCRGVWRHVDWEAEVQRFLRGPRECVGRMVPCSINTCPAKADARTERRNVPRILVSACLLGSQVTYHGRCFRLRRGSPLSFMLDVLWCEKRIIECVPVCPEMQLLLLPSPWPPLRLVEGLGAEVSPVLSPSPSARDDLPPLSAPPTSVAVTNSLTRDALFNYTATDSLSSLVPVHKHLKQQKAPVPVSDRTSSLLVDDVALMACNIDGAVFKSRSPSCGVYDARCYRDDGAKCYSRNSVAVPGRAFRECDGFFVSMLRRTILDDSSLSQGTSLVPYCQPPVMITTERRLQWGDLCHSLVSEEVQQRCTDSSSGTVDTIIPFLESVLTHFEHRVPGKSVQGDPPSVPIHMAGRSSK